MSDAKELERRVLALEKECRRLSDIESIRQMRYRYWRAIRDADLDALLKLFSEHPCADFGLGEEMAAEGKACLAEVQVSSSLPFTLVSTYDGVCSTGMTSGEKQSLMV